MIRDRHRAWLALGVGVVAMLALVKISFVYPQIRVRWREGISAADRAIAERKYDLRNGAAVEGRTSAYELGDGSSGNLRALIQDPVVEDTGNIDRDALTAPGRRMRITTRRIPFPLDDRFDRPSQLLQLHQSLTLFLAGGVLLLCARAAPRRAMRIAIATLLAVGVMAVAFPIDLSIARSGARDKIATRGNFERYFGGRVRFEKHLSQTILLEVYNHLEPTAAAPERALVILSRAATAWFVLSALTVGFVERWSAVALRYLALALLAPASLLYFGWLEIGYVSLCMAGFPLLARGLGDGGRRLEAGSALTGLGAALHGSGLLALAGAGLAAVGATARAREKLDRVLRVIVWGTAAYVGWIAVYVIALHMRVEPSDQTNSWRSLFVQNINEGRVAPALFSATGMRDLWMELWVSGALLLPVVLTLRRRCPHEWRVALWYVPASLLFLIFRAPFEGIGLGVDLVVAGFPALYALAWVCAHDWRRTVIAALILISSHLAFWRIVLDQRYQNVVIDQYAVFDR